MAVDAIRLLPILLIAFAGVYCEEGQPKPGVRALLAPPFGLQIPIPEDSHQEPDRQFHSKLVAAARNCDPQHFRDVLEANHNSINSRVQGGETALTYAAWYGKTECLRLLLESGADVNARTHGNETALHYALYNGSIMSVLALLEAGADIEAVESARGYTPLMVSAGLGRWNETVLLLELGVDENVRDFDGRTALMHAIRGGHPEVAQLLLSGYTETRDAFGESALFYSIRARWFALTEAMLRHGHDPDIRNNLGETPLMLAASRGNLAVVRLLLSYGANSELLENTGRYDALRIARSAGFTEVAALLDSPIRQRILRFSAIATRVWD